ncbi:mucin-5AC-like isoform X2 [Lates japonicus]|uniref:Mucin-5AC-like isoform X2 n=1 Tax=Lates japonicus TaxID=270547 RepID=A0AAD3R0Q1_LATJO|nr:mucin-5AC-like isoform X2 [Lates japonicus]GLD50610.1 mucin-5AC-like isoform X2 [Lates japonicus]
MATYPDPVVDNTHGAPSSVPRPGYFLPLVVCVPVGFVLTAVSLLVFYLCKTRRKYVLKPEGKTNNINMELPVTYENPGPVSKCEDSVCQRI